MYSRFLNLLILVFLFSSCSKSVQLTESIMSEPQYELVNYTTEIPKYEFRGAWVATIANIDWPSKKGLNTAAQKDEYLAIVNHHKKRGINALLVQVRAASDAFYAKSNEPWSEWLMGEQGKSPSPYYDPMKFMIEETHKQGMEFHAWLNLNRGKHRLASSVMKDHLIYQKPEWFLTYGKYKLYNFGIPEVRAYITDLVLNIVKEYDVDGIHFDDYFYPYKVNGLELNDAETFRNYPNGINNIEDWRRNNIDLIIKGIAEAISHEKSWVKFGISPFGVWRNKRDDPAGSDTRGGQPSYDFLYANTKKWAELGWIDYIAPQIYFPFEHKLVPYATLTDWWADNHGKAHLYIGHGVYRVDKNSSLKAWRDSNQIGRQMAYNRLSSQVAGSIFYNSNTFIKNELGLADIIESYYKYPALTPKMPWKNTVTAAKPLGFQSEKLSADLKLSWQSPNPKQRYVLYRFEKDAEFNIADPTKILAICACSEYLDISRASSKSYVYVLRALDRLENESEAAFLLE